MVLRPEEDLQEVLLMQGFHEVKEFLLTDADRKNGILMPDGWKPFGCYTDVTGMLHVVARKWQRRDGIRTK